MNKDRIVTIATLAVLSGAQASAQYVKGNEAVQTTPTGAKRVERPPTTGVLLSKPCLASDAVCTAAGWKMVETAQGLQEHGVLCATRDLSAVDFWHREAHPALDRQEGGPVVAVPIP